MNVLKVIPRLKEGGDFVYFRNLEEAKIAQEYLSTMNFNDRKVDAHIVHVIRYVCESHRPLFRDLLLLKIWST